MHLNRKHIESKRRSHTIRTFSATPTVNATDTIKMSTLTRIDSNDTLFNASFNNNNTLNRMNSELDHFNLLIIPKQSDANSNNNITNDLTGNTLTSQTSEQVEQRRLSISDYNTEKPNYYEYEFLHRKEVNRIDEFFRFDMSMMSIDDEDEAMQQETEPELPTDDLNMEEEGMMDQKEIMNQDDISSTRKVMNYFKLNIFGNNNNSTSSFDEQMIFKKRYFWNRNKKLKNYDDEMNRHILDETNEQYNDVNSMEENDDDELLVEETHLLVNPAQLIATSTSNNASTNIIVSNNNPFNTEIFFNDPFYALPTPVTTNNAQHQPLLEDEQLEIHDELNNNVNLVPKKLGTLSKTRGRKPSLILDASKQFACDYCERRFKRQEHLKRHVRSLHMGEKPFGCHICDKKFSRSDNLNQHIKTHSS